MSHALYKFKYVPEGEVYEKVFHYCVCGEWWDEAKVGYYKKAYQGFADHFKQISEPVTVASGEPERPVKKVFEFEAPTEIDGPSGFYAEKIERLTGEVGPDHHGDNTGRCEYVTYNDARRRAFRCESNQFHAGPHYVYDLYHSNAYVEIPSFEKFERCESKRGTFYCEFVDGHDGYHGSGDQAWVSLWPDLGKTL